MTDKANSRIDRCGAATAVLSVIFLCTSCGGSGGGVVPPPPPPPPSPPPVQPLLITTNPLPDVIAGTSYSYTLQATGGKPPYSWALTYRSGPLPLGLTLSSGGTISGTATQTGYFQISYGVQDSAGQAAANTQSLYAAYPLTIVTTSLPAGLVSRNYYAPLTATGGKSSYSWILASGSAPLPPGLNLYNYGGLGGAPTTAGSYAFTLQVADSSTHTQTQNYTLDIYSGPLITTTQLTAGIAGQPYSATLQASGGSPPYTWDQPPGAYPLPSGFTLSSGGVLSGTSTSPTYFSVGVRVQDSLGHADVATFQLTIVPVLTLNPISLTSGNVAIAYGPYSLWSSGGMWPFTWSVVTGSGSLPAGLSLSSSGLISGTPTSAGNFNFTVQVQDSIGQQATQTTSIQIKNNVYITTSSLPYGVVNQTYSQQTLAAVGGTTPYTWSIASGTFPPGLTLDAATGKVSGTPTAGSNYAFVIQAQDSSSPAQTSTLPMALLIRPPLTVLTSTLADAAVNAYYWDKIQADGGKMPPYALRITSGALPTGISIYTTSDSNGVFTLNGYSSSTGLAKFTVEVSDSSTPAATTTKDLSIQTNSRVVIGGNSSIPSIIQGQPFTYTFSAAGGVPPYTWNMQNPPAGMSIDSASGIFSGTPSAPFNGTLFVSASDSAKPPQQVSQSVLWQVVPLLKITTSQLPSFAANVPIRVIPALTGGNCCAYTWSIASGSLPPGLTFKDAASGEIVGNATSPGSYTFTYQVKDSGTGSLAQSASQSLTLVVRASGQSARNDTIATATPLSNGTYRASLSPADDGFGNLQPDNDYYAITANPGSVIIVETIADRLNPSSPMDSVIEIVDSNGVQYQTCSPSLAYYGYYQPCMNDDIYYDQTLDSKLWFQVPGTAGGPAVTFYVHVLDWSGNARPDFIYLISISGAN